VFPTTTIPAYIAGWVIIKKELIFTLHSRLSKVVIFNTPIKIKILNRVKKSN
jgi:hypothetical protein